MEIHALIFWISHEIYKYSPFPHDAICRITEGNTSIMEGWGIKIINAHSINEYNFSSEIVFRFIIPTVPEDYLKVGTKLELYDGTKIIGYGHILKPPALSVLGVTND